MNSARIYTGIEFSREHARLPHTARQAGLEALRSALLSRFGGFTEIEGRGQWRDDTGTVHVEKCTIFDVIAETITGTDLCDALSRANGHLQQSTYLININGHAEFIRPVEEDIKL
mgnify:CR=1 FL=1